MNETSSRLARGVARILVTAPLWFAVTGCQESPPGAADLATPLLDDAPAPVREDFATWLPRRKGMNLIVVSFDALRADALGLYGQSMNTSPAIDAFAEKCLVFDHAHSCGPDTPTSFAAAFSGGYPFRVFQAWTLKSEHTLASTLQAAGYRTAGLINNPQVTAGRGFDKGFEDYSSVGRWSDEVTLQEGASWLHRNAERPFFLWLHFITPHTPYFRRDLGQTLYEPCYRGPYREVVLPDDDATNRVDLERIRSLYRGQVAYVDDLFGRTLEHIESLGLLENSLVVVTADHGEQHMEHGLFGHVHLTEDTIRIPLLIYHPDVRRMHRTMTPFENVDLFPTLVDLLDLDVPGGLDGKSLLEGDPSRDDIVSIAMSNPVYRAVSIQRGPAKLIVRLKPDHREELYDLRTDPGERNNLAQRDPAAVERLSTALWDFAGPEAIQVLYDLDEGKELEDLTPAEIRIMKGFGYLGGAKDG